MTLTIKIRKKGIWPESRESQTLPTARQAPRGENVIFVGIETDRIAEGALLNLGWRRGARDGKYHHHGAYQAESDAFHEG